MSEVYFTSDWHLGHRNILKYRDGVATIRDHDQLLFANHRSVVSKRDTTYFLGDMLFEITPAYRSAFAQLQGRKILLLGNHDNRDIRSLLSVFDDVVGPIKYNSKFWLTHHPMHPQELYGKINIHGHTHNQMVLDNGRIDNRYFNVCPDVNSFMPVPLSIIKGS